MKVVVVIPTLDEASTVGRAVASAAHDDVDVVVVDGGSRDGTAARAAEAGARVVASERGRALQLAKGVEASDGDVVLFLHADTRLPPGYRAAIAEALRDPTAVAGAFRFAFDRTSPALRVVEWGARLRSSVFGLPYGDQALFVRRSALEAVGGVPQVRVMEDLDLVVALRRLGRLALCREVAVTSARRYDAGGVWRTMFGHWLAAAAWGLGIDRERIAGWLGR